MGAACPGDHSSAKHLGAISFRLCRCPANCSLDGPREVYGYEEIGRVQIVFAGLVDHPNLMALRARFVREDLINLARLQGSRVTLVANANDVLC